VPLAYYSRSATTEFWSEHWGSHSVTTLLEIARHSPLTALIERHLPPRGLVLEAGCGLGQYVLLLRERGHAAVGADWSVEALRAGGRAGAPLAAMDLRALGLRAGAAAAYLSLGVVEHDPAGPHAIVAEAARVLMPGGVLLLSVPYWNGVRRLSAPWLARDARRTQAAGGQFYQFAFTRREVGRFLDAAGFRVQSFHPYDPARILRGALRRVRRGTAAAPRSTLAPSAPAVPPTPDGASRGPRRLLRAALYSPPALRLLGHMVLAVAVKPEAR
jgi:SAM-dependent methyltransferase